MTSDILQENHNNGLTRIEQITFLLSGSFQGKDQRNEILR